MTNGIIGGIIGTSISIVGITIVVIKYLRRNKNS